MKFEQQLEKMPEKTLVNHYKQFKMLEKFGIPLLAVASLVSLFMFRDAFTYTLAFWGAVIYVMVSLKPKYEHEIQRRLGKISKK